MIPTDRTPPWKTFLFLIQGKILCFEEQTWLRSHHTWDVNKKTHEGGWRGESGQRSVGVTPDNRYSAHRLCLLQVWTIPDVIPIKGPLKSLLRTAGCETWFFFFFFTVLNLKIEWFSVLWIVFSLQRLKQTDVRGAGITPLLMYSIF